MTISLNITVDLVRKNFRDVKWSQDTLEEWVKQAVKEYSKHFPLVSSVTDSAVAGTYKYDFFAGAHDEEDLPVVLAVTKFEYPTGEDPPKYPKRKSHTQDFFFDGDDDFYDVVIFPNRTNGEVWLSDPETGSSFQIWFHTEHAWTSVDSDTDENTEVAGNHQPIIIQYVTWLCWREMISEAQMNLDKDEYTSKIRAIVERADYEYIRYTDMIHDAEKAVSPESETIVWAMDKYDRIY